MPFRYWIDPCPQCNKPACKSFATFEKHWTTAHPDIEMPLYQCPDCFKMLKGGAPAHDENCALRDRPLALTSTSGMGTAEKIRDMGCSTCTECDGNAGWNYSNQQRRWKGNIVCRYCFQTPDKQVIRSQLWNHVFCLTGSTCAICEHSFDESGVHYDHINPFVKTNEISVIIQEGNRDMLVEELRHIQIIHPVCHYIKTSIEMDLQIISGHNSVKNNIERCDFTTDEKAAKTAFWCQKYEAILPDVHARIKMIASAHFFKDLD
jgi:hypothetical protein